METSVFLPEPEPRITLTFESRAEAAALYDELCAWTPTGHWSNQAQALFDALQLASKGLK